MKKTLLLCATLWLTNSIIAQDVCAELMKFNSYEKYIHRTMRMTSKLESVGQTMIMERDKNGNMHQTVTVEKWGNKMKGESIIIGTMMYMKKNDEDWKPQPMDSVQMATIKSQWQNNQLQFFKNCQKLDNETQNGKTYRVYKGDFDVEQLKNMMKNSTQPMPNMDQMSKMDMKMTFYVNAQDDVEKVIVAMNVQGQSLDSVMTYEYDIPVIVVSPPPPPPAKKN